MPAAERILLNLYTPQILAARARQLVQIEGCKGCMADIYPMPVHLEPAYHPIATDELMRLNQPEFHKPIQETIVDGDLTRLRLWISPQQQSDWNRSEGWLKGMSNSQHRCAFEIIGNRDRIVYHLLAHSVDVPIMRPAFTGEFERCAITPIDMRDDQLRTISLQEWAQAEFLDYYPTPPYSNLMTAAQEELQRSPYTILFAALTEIVPPALGIYQVVFQPVRATEGWKSNVRTLVDVDFRAGLGAGVTGFERFAQQSPSADLRQMAMDVERKAHNDKFFAATAIRIAVLRAGDRAAGLLRSLGAMMGMIQHGGVPLNTVSAKEYRSVLGPEAVQSMFVAGAAYRPGFILNSRELASLVHIPPPATIEHFRHITDPLDTLPIPKELRTGTPIGYCIHAGERVPVCIPDGIRKMHLHMIGGTMCGKSTAMCHIALHDIRRGDGVAVIDPHGSLIQDILARIPEEAIDRVIVFDPNDRWIPIWNPLDCGTNVSPSRLADDTIGAMKSFMDGFGDRLEHLLRHAIYGVRHLPGGTLRDAADILRKDSDASEWLRTQVSLHLRNDAANDFWKQDFKKYTRADLHPPAHKLGKFIVNDAVGKMLSQSESTFSLRDIMDTGKVLLVDLSHLGSEERDVLGCLMLSLLHLTALGRENVPTEQRRLFHIHCDEAPRLVTDALEDTINETRKYNVTLTLAHQQLSQFSTRKQHAIASVGTRMIFRVIDADAGVLARTLQGKVDADLLEAQLTGQAVARIGPHVVRVETPPPLPVTANNPRDRIIERSHQLYYKPAAEVERVIQARRARWARSGEEEATTAPSSSEALGKEGGDEYSGKEDDNGYDFESF